MSVWIGLFRGINVGGNNLLPMKSLPALIEQCGGRDAKTYIQSGNVVFRSAAKNAGALAKKISAAVMQAHGFEPRVMLRSLPQMEQAVAANPYPQAQEAPTTLHCYFLAEALASAPCAKLDEIKAEGESWILLDDVFYLYTPDGVGKSKLAERAPKILGVDATARNWRSVIKVLEMAREMQQT